ncbi:MAG: hypothetical protein V4513_01430 [Pseudomonadota bacterium]
MKRGEELARLARQQRLQEVAQHLRGLLGDGAVAVEEARVLVRGKGMIKRWLIDPQLRFLK